MISHEKHAAAHYRWSEVPAEVIGGLITRRYINGDHLTVAHFDVKQGGMVPSHGHDPEEVLCVLKGALKITIGGDETIVSEGEVLQIPGGVAHRIEALEDTSMIDIFSAIRRDWINKTDTYYQR